MALTIEQQTQFDEAEVLIDTLLDKTAVDYGFKNMAVACSYVTSEDASYKGNSIALSNYRDSVWRTFFDLQKKAEEAEEVYPVNFIMAQLPCVEFEDGRVYDPQERESVPISDRIRAIRSWLEHFGEAYSKAAVKAGVVLEEITEEAQKQMQEWGNEFIETNKDEYIENYLKEQQVGQTVSSS